MQREKWGSRLGFILAAVGSAVGLGNIWRFPTIVGISGGGAFLFVYLLIIIFVGIPLIIGELAIGRRGKSNIVSAFKEIKPDGKWWIIGTLGVATGFIVLSFYSVISGWAMAYVFKFISGDFVRPNTLAAVQSFESLVSNAYVPLVWHGLFMGLVVFVVILGIHKGIEKASKILMPVLFLLLIVLMLRSITLKGAAEGVAWFFRPDWSQLSFSTVLGALGQVFFSLSLGMGTIITYGSYLSEKENIPSNSIIIAAADIGIAILAALIIIPAVFAYGVQPDIGVPLIFVTLPMVFGSLPLGSFFGALFFILLVIAALTSGISLLQVVVAYFSETFAWSRKKASVLTGTVIFILGIPSALSAGLLADVKIFNEPLLEMMDMLSSKILLPISGLLTAIFIGWIWKPKAAVMELRRNGIRFSLSRQWGLIVKFVLPAVLSYIVISGFF